MSKSQHREREVDPEYKGIEDDLTKINRDLNKAGLDLSTPRKSDGYNKSGSNEMEGLSEDSPEDHKSELSSNAKEIFRNSGLDEETQKIADKLSEKLETKLIQEEFYKVYSPVAINILFYALFIGNILLNIDHGSLPGCSI